MQMVDMFYEELEDAKKRKVPFVIPIGTIEYHGYHASCGTDTMVITGVMRELEKTKEMVVCPPIWYGVASYAVAGPESGTIQVDVDAYEKVVFEPYDLKWLERIRLWRSSTQVSISSLTTI